MSPRIAAALLLIGCGPKDSDSGGANPGGPPLERLVELVEQAGWTARIGTLSTATMEWCCEPLVYCLGVDPAAPYQAYALPPAPEQAAADLDLFWMWSTIPEGTTRDFRMRPDEALVWIGSTPPPVEYFGLRTMVSSRADDSGSRARVLGALGSPLNHRTIAAERGIEPSEVWNQPLIAITSADQAIENQVRSWLKAAGYDLGTVHSDRVAASYARLGLGPEADTLVSLIQTLDPDRDPEVAAWREGEATLLRLTPPGPASSPDPFLAPSLADRGTGVSEDGYTDALEELRLALRARWSTQLAVPGLFGWDWHHTFACLVDLDCQGDTHDRLRAQSLPFSLEPGSFAVAYGVNHVATGKTSASTLSAYRQLTGTGVAWTTGADLVGSARPWLGDNHPLVDDLYAVVISRDCTDFDVSCVEVPSTCPGPLPDEDLTLSWGLYLEPGTGAAPLSDELTLDRVLKFFAEATP